MDVELFFKHVACVNNFSEPFWYCLHFVLKNEDRKTKALNVSFYYWLQISKVIIGLHKISYQIIVHHWIPIVKK